MKGEAMSNEETFEQEYQRHRKLLPGLSSRLLWFHMRSAKRFSLAQAHKQGLYGLAYMSRADFEDFVKARRNERKQPVGATPAQRDFDALDLEEEALAEKFGNYLCEEALSPEDWTRNWREKYPLVRKKWEQKNRERMDRVWEALDREWETQDVRTHHIDVRSLLAGVRPPTPPTPNFKRRV
jgi:hypothetical protein